MTIVQTVAATGRIQPETQINISADVSAKGLALTVETPGAPYWMRGDGDRLQQVFWNLLRNAVKFTPQHGRISVRAALVPSEECPRAREGPPPAADARRPADDNHQCSGNLVVDVTDNGAGVAPDLLPRLFDAFEQAGSSSTSGGLGLGLTICKAVVEMHGGSIAMHSDGPGRGTSVTVKLPMPRCPLSSTVEPVSQPPDEPADVSPDERPRGRLKIVLVEDHAETAQVLRRLLASRGHEVTTAEGIVTGLAAVERIDPDVLISDLGLPDGNGLDLMRQLLKRGKRIPAIALSGYGSPADIQKSMAAGFLEHLVKPLCSVDALTDALGRLNLRTRNP
jgi:CheY-like chemotaxis protein